MTDVATGIAVAGILGALLGAFVALLVVAARADLRRLNCRCCGAALDEPGGRGVIGLGFGFCERCAQQILEKKLTL